MSSNQSWNWKQLLLSAVREHCVGKTPRQVIKSTLLPSILRSQQEDLFSSYQIHKAESKQKDPRGYALVYSNLLTSLPYLSCFLHRATKKEPKQKDPRAFFHNITRAVRFNMDASVNEAALLLQEVAQLASKELSQQGEKRKRVEIVSPRESSESWSSSDESDSPQSVSPSDSPDYRQGRIRTDSVSSPVLVALRVEGLGMSPLPPPPWTLQSRRVWLQSRKVRLVTPPPKALAPPPRFPVLDRPAPTLRHVIHTVPELEINSSTKPKYVGMHTPRKQVLGILQRKFTWKNYPEVSASW